MITERLNILGLQVTHICFSEALGYVKELAYRHTPSYVCFANSHMVIEGHRDSKFAKQVNAATLVLADGMPVARSCFFLFEKKQERIAGMDFMPRLLASLNKEPEKKYRVFFYGSTPQVLNALKERIENKYRNVIVAGAESPPFRSMNQNECEAYVDTINLADPHIVFVSLGCPKQEKWMATHYKKINAVLLGVGGAFLTTAELQKRAPGWMQKTSLEWLFRFVQEPRRLFKRYLITNSIFLFLISKSWLKKITNAGK